MPRQNWPSSQDGGYITVDIYMRICQIKKNVQISEISTSVLQLERTIRSRYQTDRNSVLPVMFVALCRDNGWSGGGRGSGESWSPRPLRHLRACTGYIISSFPASSAEVTYQRCISRRLRGRWLSCSFPLSSMEKTHKKESQP